VKFFFKRREYRLYRYFRLTLIVAAAILAATVVSTLTVDLGPALRARAERAASGQLDRQVTIGTLGVRVFTGRFVVGDFSIGGRRPGDRPFFTARQLMISLDWSTALQRRPEFHVTNVDLFDWNMLVEDGPDGHTFPKLPSRAASAGPRPFTTTVRFLRAWRGTFSYEHHGVPWGVKAPNIDLTITKAQKYQGTATFDGGTITIQDHLPMWLDMDARFDIDGSVLHMNRIDIETDGAQTVASGDVDLSRWPEMLYDVKSRVNFPRMREIFFRNESWELAGEGDFTGQFHLFSGGHDLAGDFSSTELGVYAYRFPALRGSLHWTRKLFEVTRGSAELYGGKSEYAFSIEPLGSPQRPTARFETSYAGVDVAAVTDFYELAGVRFAGSALGTNVLEWPLGEFSRRTVEGAIQVAMPAGVQAMTPDYQPRALDLGTPAAPLTRPDTSPPASSGEGTAADDGDIPRIEPSIPPLPGHVPITGAMTYRLDANRAEVRNGLFATERTHVNFEGETTWGEDSRFEFQVASRDYQESDQILAGILTDFGAPTRAVAFGGRGSFAGVMTGPFRRPRVEGVFQGEELHAWDTLWGSGTARIVVENGYLTVTDGVVRHVGSEIQAAGLFSLGYPRRDEGQEIDARFRVARRDVDSLRHAFGIDDYPLSGELTGEFHLTGKYEEPFGFGSMTIAKGIAWGEPFETGTASLRFDGKGIRLDSVSLSAVGGGAMTGAAYVGWDATYSFNSEARRIPVNSIAAFAFPALEPTGWIDFTAGGSGTFESPRYEVKFQISDLAVKNENVGQVTGALALRNGELTGRVDAASPRLTVTGTGRIALTPQADAELSFRFNDTSLDLPARLYFPTLSPLATAVASGSIRVVGALADVDRLLVESVMDNVEMRLFDYAVKNAGPVRLALDQHLLRVESLQLVGEGTRLTIGGSIALHDQTIALKASGDANLAILQGFFGDDLRASGRAELLAAVEGPLYQPVFSGRATVADGRIRHFALPNSLDDMNGDIRFDSRGVQLDDLSATLGGGRVQFGGRIVLDGYLPGEMNVSARGEGMQLRYPEGVRSMVDADLTIRGNVKAPAVGGAVTVRSATWNRRIDPTGGLFEFGGSRAGAGGAESSASAFPVRLDIEVHVPSTLRIENNLARLVASADLQLRGTLDRPILLGSAQVDRGEVTFEGRRYFVTKGAIEFTNPTRIEPFFDIEAETRVRVPGQTYRVVVRAAGTTARMFPELESDPPLPEADVLALLFSDVRRTSGDTPGDIELRARQSQYQNERQQDILMTRATQMLANPISSEVGRVVEQAFGVDTFQLTPSLIDPYNQSTTTYRVNPSARVTIGKRVSERVYLTYSRSVSSSINDQIVLLEYDESDRLSWILSRNEDSTYAIEVRVRHAF
jgi:hypothetical protein